MSAFDERLVEKFGYPMPDFDLASYAVRNFGAIDLDLADSRTTVRFRWLTVTAAAIDAASKLLRQLPPGQVTVHCQSNEWTEQTFSSGEEAVEWIAASLAAQGDGRPVTTSHLVASPRDLQSISGRSLNRLEEADDHFSLLFKKWRLSHHRFTSQITETLIRFGDIDRAVIACERTDGKIVFEHVGARITLYDRADDAWMFRLHGRPVSEQPDAKYGRYAESVFRKTLDEGQPRLDHVDAIVNDGRGPVRFRYDRLLLPWQMDNGARVLTTLSYKTDPDTAVAA
jgi:hypothetical protein